MIEVNVDITGFFYREKVVVPDGGTVFDAMLAAQTLANPQQALKFSPDKETSDPTFINEILVEHKAPKSRQVGLERVIF